MGNPNAFRKYIGVLLSVILLLCSCNIMDESSVQTFSIQSASSSANISPDFFPTSSPFPDLTLPDGNIFPSSSIEILYPFDEYGRAIFVTKPDSYFGVIDKSHKVIIEPIYDEISGFNADGIARFILWQRASEGEYIHLQPSGETQRFGYLDINGKVVIQPDYLYLSEKVNEGQIIARNQDYKTGTIDQSGKTVVPFDFDHIEEFKNGIAETIKENKWGYIDTSGHIVLPFQYESVLWRGQEYPNGYFIGYPIFRFGAEENKTDWDDPEAKFGVCQYEVIKPDGTVVHQSPLFGINYGDLKNNLGNEYSLLFASHTDGGYPVYQTEGQQQVAMDLNGLYGPYGNVTVENGWWKLFENGPPYMVYLWNESIPYILVPMPKG